MGKWVLLVACLLALPAGADNFVQKNEAQQQALLKVLQRAKVIDPIHRYVNKVRLVCTLQTGKRRLSVVYVEEMIPAAQSPRGWPTVALFDANGRLLRKFWTSSEPDTCRGDLLLFPSEFSDKICGVTWTGNLIRFDQQARPIGTLTLDASALWPNACTYLERSGREASANDQAACQRWGHGQGRGMTRPKQVHLSVEDLAALERSRIEMQSNTSACDE